MRRSIVWTVPVLALGVLIGWLVAGDRSPPVTAGAAAAPPVPAPVANDPPAQPPAPKADPVEAAIRAFGADYVKTFNAGDAKAVAAFWTTDGEMTITDGETIRGRDAIEKSLAAQFKAQPKAAMQATVDSIRAIGKHTVTAEGTVKMRYAGESEDSETAYRALFVREDDGWRIASVTEWEVDAGLSVTPKDLGWLVGDWTAKGDGRNLKLTYTWDENKVFMHGTYALSKDGAAVASGTQIIAKNPAGGLRSWLFDTSGTFGESVWVRDGKRWLIEASGTLPDGTEITATNIFIPLGPDAFSWQSTERTANGVALADQAPVKVTRVKK